MTDYFILALDARGDTYIHPARGNRQASMSWNFGFPKWSIEVREHLTHGRGTAEDGPDAPDCGCRNTEAMNHCALAGCGFCRPMGAKRLTDLQGPSPKEIAKAKLALAEADAITNDPTVNYEKGEPLIAHGAGPGAPRRRRPYLKEKP